MFDSELLTVMVFALGAAMTVLIPYLIKARESGVSFDAKYFYGMVVTIVIAALVALPAEVDSSFRGLVLVFLAGSGMQGAMNKAVNMRKK